MQFRQVPSVTSTPAATAAADRDEGSRSSQRVPRSVLSNEEVAADYENRIAFIQKQHEKMLGALHLEVDQLKRKNKGNNCMLLQKK